MKKLTIFAAAILVLMLPVLAAAEIRAGSFEVNPYAGLHIFDSNGNDGSLDNGAVYGLRFGNNYT